MMIATLLVATAPLAAVPAEAWQVETKGDFCLVSRREGAGADADLVGFQPAITRARLDVLVIARARSARQSAGDATIVRARDGRVFAGRYITLPTVTMDRAVTRIEADPALFDMLDAADVLTITAGSLRRRIAVGALAETRPQLDACERGLLRAWGLDPAVRPVTGPRMRGDIARYFSWQDYPHQALSNRNIGRVAAIVIVDATGKVASCRIVVGAGRSLDEAVCARATGIAFDPATDAAGRPVASPYSLTVHWGL